MAAGTGAAVDAATAGVSVVVVVVLAVVVVAVDVPAGNKIVKYYIKRAHHTARIA